MARKNEVVEAVPERAAVRAIYKNAHCRTIKNRKGFFVFYTDEFNKQLIIGQDDMNRANAWRKAAEFVGIKLVKKLES